jgi:hypothetical protein
MPSADDAIGKWISITESNVIEEGVVVSINNASSMENVTINVLLVEPNNQIEKRIFSITDPRLTWMQMLSERDKENQILR